MAPLIPDKKCLVVQHENFSLCIKNTAGYHLGPVAPSATDPAPLGILPPHLKPYFYSHNPVDPNHEGDSNPVSFRTFPNRSNSFCQGKPGSLMLTQTPFHGTVDLNCLINITPSFIWNSLNRETRSQR